MTSADVVRRARYSMLGGIVGDAFGSPYQFMTRGTFDVSPDMAPCEYFGTPVGAFTDDSSMMLCLASSLVTTGRFDPEDQMDRYAHWLCDGYMSSIGRAFDIGRTTVESVGAYVRDKSGGQRQGGYGLVGEAYRGNGGIMRLAPVVAWTAVRGETRDTAVERARVQSAVTHADPVCLECAAAMAGVLWDLIHGATKDSALDALAAAEFETPELVALCGGGYKTTPARDVRTSGYVIDTLGAALWTLWHADGYEDGVMTLAAMGDDADTTCCVYGQLAGALYKVPSRWLDALMHRGRVEAIVDDVCDVALDDVALSADVALGKEVKTTAILGILRNVGSDLRSP